MLEFLSGVRGAMTLPQIQQGVGRCTLAASRTWHVGVSGAVTYARRYSPVVSGVLLVVTMLLQIPVCRGIDCYICENELSNDLCHSELNLQTCEDGMDTCQTIVSYSEVSEKLAITKSCTKNVSCELQVNVTMETMPCDASLGTWVCTNCCHEDACNYDVAEGLHRGLHWVPLVFAALSVIILSVQL